MSGGSGPPNGGQDDVRSGEPLGEPLLTSSRPPFGGHDLQTMEIIRSVSSFEKIRTITAQIFLYRKLILPPPVINTTLLEGHTWPFSTSKLMVGQDVVQLRVVVLALPSILF